MGGSGGRRASMALTCFFTYPMRSKSRSMPLTCLRSTKATIDVRPWSRANSTERSRSAISSNVGGLLSPECSVTIGLLGAQESGPLAAHAAAADGGGNGHLPDAAAEIGRAHV